VLLGAIPASRGTPAPSTMARLWNCAVGSPIIIIAAIVHVIEWKFCVTRVIRIRAINYCAAISRNINPQQPRPLNVLPARSLARGRLRASVVSYIMHASSRHPRTRFPNFAVLPRSLNARTARLHRPDDSAMTQ